MTGLSWTLVGLGAWCLVSVPMGMLVGRVLRERGNMTQDAIRRAVQSAVREAFNAGVASARERRSADVSTLRNRAVTYGEDLIMPMTELAIEEAREQGWVAAKRASEPAGP